MEKTIVITGAFRFNCNEAAEPRVLNNAKIFRELGYRVVFVCWGGKYNNEEKVGERYFKQGFEYTITNDLLDNTKSSFVVRLVTFMLRGKKSINSIISHKPQIVVGYNPPGYFTSKMLHYAKKFNFHFISDITEWYDANEFIGGKWLPFSWSNDYNMAFTQKKVKNKIVISHFLDRHYSSNNIILPPLVDLQDEKWHKESAHKEIPPFDGLTFIFAGYHGIKDLLGNIIEGVCQSISRGARARLLILGAESSQIEELMGQDKFERFSGTILPVGRVAQDNVPSYYAAADFSFVIRKPLRKNMAGFPTKFVESMVAGCPVVANSTSDLGDYIIVGENGFVVADWSTDSISNFMAALSQMSKEEITEMKVKAAEHGRKNFDYKAYVEKTALFLTKIRLT